MFCRASTPSTPAALVVPQYARAYVCRSSASQRLFLCSGEVRRDAHNFLDVPDGSCGWASIYRYMTARLLSLWVYDKSTGEVFERIPSSAVFRQQGNKPASTKAVSDDACSYESAALGRTSIGGASGGQHPGYERHHSPNGSGIRSATSYSVRTKKNGYWF